MKLFNKLKLLHAAFALIAYGSSMHAVTSITENGNLSFSGVITSTGKAFNRYTGTLYVGTQLAPNTDNSNTDATFALALAARNDTIFTPLATNANATSVQINGIALINPTLQESAYLVYLQNSLNATNKTQVQAMLLPGVTTVTPAPTLTPLAPFVAGGASLTDSAAATTALVSLISTSSRHIFARVWANGAASENVTHAGIANLRLDPLTNNTFTIVQGNGVTGSLELDTTVAEVKTAGAIQALNPTIIQVNDMAWDEDLKALYIGLNNVVNSSTNSNQGMLSIVKARFDATGGLLHRERITQLDPHNFDATNIFTYVSSAAAQQTKVVANKVRVMTTSTGLKYLILNGGFVGGTNSPIVSARFGSNVAGNEIFALRLAKTQGTNFNIGDIIRNDMFTETSLTASFTGLQNLDSAIVGSRVLEVDATFTVSDMVVVGDTVFASIVTNSRVESGNGTLFDPGIYASQAMFDQDGLITAWTKWERVFPSLSNGADTINANFALDSVAFFAVDAANGKIWRGDATGRTVTRLGWKLPAAATANSILAALNTGLPDGCFSVLDLPSGTPGIVRAGTSTANSFALFGGFEKVAFARTKSGIAGNFAVTNPGTTAPVQNFGTATNFSVIPTGLTGVGPIRSLGFSYRQDPGHTDNYFFAGTNNGLYAFAQSNGNGFDGTLVSDLASAPFTSAGATWTQIGTGVTTFGNACVSQIVTGSNNVYVLTVDKTTKGGVVDKLFAIPLANEAATTFSANVSALIPSLIAQSGMGGIPTNSVITGFALLCNGQIVNPNIFYNDFTSPTGNLDAYFGVISTNNGVYTTTCDLRDLVQVNTATVAGTQQEWEAVNKTPGISFFAINRLKDSRGGNAVWYPFDDDPVGKSLVPRIRSFDGIFITDDSRDLGIFDNSRFMQGGNNSNALRTNSKNGLLPGDFPLLLVPDSSGVDTAVQDRRFFMNASPTIKDVDFSLYLKNDGARRFFTRFNPDEDGIWNALRVLPFDAQTWGLAATGPTADPDLASINRIFWVETISGCGNFLAGTDTGVVSLE